jgi:hypothetical protein
VKEACNALQKLIHNYSILQNQKDVQQIGCRYDEIDKQAADDKISAIEDLFYVQNSAKTAPYMTQEAI